MLENRSGKSHFIMQYILHQTQKDQRPKGPEQHLSKTDQANHTMQILHQTQNDKIFLHIVCKKVTFINTV